LAHISENEFMKMRETILETNHAFKNSEDIILDSSIHDSLSKELAGQNVIVRIIKYPIPLYKIAVSIIIIVGILFCFKSLNKSGGQNLLVVHDTVLLKKTDTIYSRISDTVKIVKTKIVYLTQNNENNIPKQQYFASNNLKLDCKKELCPDDVERITKLSVNNNISNDSFLRDFVVSIK